MILLPQFLEKSHSAKVLNIIVITSYFGRIMILWDFFREKTFCVSMPGFPLFYNFLLKERLWGQTSLRQAAETCRLHCRQECFRVQGFWDWQKVHGVKDWSHMAETAFTAYTSQDKACFSIRCFCASPSSSYRSDSNSITTKVATLNYTNGIHNQHWQWSQKGVDSELCQRCLY